MTRGTALCLAIGTALVVLPLLGGSMIRYADGARGLDIDGAARRNDRPAHVMEIGHGWSHYCGDPGGHRYSSASQITIDNVGSLMTVWEYRTGDLATKAQLMDQSASQATPILVEDSLVFCTPFNEIIALDPGDGSQRWRFDPAIDLDQRPANQFVCRGVTHWRDPTPSAACASRIFMGTNDARLIAVDAVTGRPCDAFGSNGEVHVNPGMELLWPGEFQITSPPVVIGDIIVVGSAIGDNARVAAPAGSVRAFDARSGAPRWAWDPIPRTANDPAISSWQGAYPPPEGHANAWAPLAVDEQRGLVFVPTTSPSPDFFGGLRPGDNRHANAVVALEAATGELRWSFQTVHHDVWDYDVPAQPGLYSVWRGRATARRGCPGHQDRLCFRARPGRRASRFCRSRNARSFRREQRGGALAHAAIPGGDASARTESTVTGRRVRHHLVRSLRVPPADRERAVGRALYAAVRTGDHPVSLHRRRRRTGAARRSIRRAISS